MGECEAEEAELYAALRRLTPPRLSATKGRSVSASELLAPSALSAADDAPEPFVYASEQFLYRLCPSGCSCCHPSADNHSDFEETLLRRWDRARDANVMNYQLNTMYKLLPGDYNLTAQLNIERGQLRRRPHPFRSLTADFDHRRFNYTKVKPQEAVLLEVLLSMRCSDAPLTESPLDRHLVMVNASPLERGHCLVVPSVQRCLPQVLDADAVRLAAHLLLLSRNPRLHVLFNSLLAFASVNHLHLHALFWPYPSDIIRRPVERLCSGVWVLRAPEQWFAPAFVFQLPSADALDQFVGCVARTADALHRSDVAHNLFVARAPPLRAADAPPNEPSAALLVTAYIFPRRSVSGAKPPTNFNAAACELAGHLLIYTFRFFAALSEQSVLRIIEMDAALEDGHFALLVSQVRALFEAA